MNRLGIVFPGQGSQSVGMLAEIASQYAEVKETFEQASQILDYDLWKLVEHGPAQELDKTIFTQPALLTASFAIWRILQVRKHLVPLFLAGHSLGEYTALVCAKVLSFEDALKLVAARGRFMQEAAADLGAMAAIIGLSEEAVLSVCKKAKHTKDEVLAPANFNSIGQIVISGHKSAVERAVVIAKENGAKLAVLLPISVPSHCLLMKPAAKKLTPLFELVNWQMPYLTVVNNVAAKPYKTIKEIRSGLAKQLYMPVRWVETIEAFKKSGITEIIECGPGKVLSGLNKRIDKNLQLKTTQDLESLETLLKED